MTTGRIIVTDALDLLSIHAAEEPLSAHQEQQGLRVLNDLVASCSLEHFLVYYTPPQVIPWPVGRQWLTWGPGGDIPGPRPLQLGSMAEARDPASGLSWPLAVLSQQQYALIAWKELLSYPAQAVYYAPNLPLAGLTCYPIPNQPHEVTVYPWLVLQQWPAFDTDILLAPGYDRFFKAAVACDLAPMYDKEIPASVVQIRAEAKSNVKGVNVQVPTLEVPDFTDGSGSGSRGSGGAHAIRSGGVSVTPP